MLAGGQVLGPLHPRQEVLAQPVAPADEDHPAVVLVEGGHLGVDHLDVQPHEPFHLFGGPAPVLGREGVEGELPDAQIARLLDHAAHGLHSGPVTGAHRQVAATSPATVAVHDDGHVVGLGPRDAVRVVLGSFAPLPGRTRVSQEGAFTSDLEDLLFLVMRPAR